MERKAERQREILSSSCSVYFRPTVGRSVGAADGFSVGLVVGETVGLEVGCVERNASFARRAPLLYERRCSARAVAFTQSAKNGSHENHVMRRGFS